MPRARSRHRYEASMNPKLFLGAAFRASWTVTFAGCSARTDSACPRSSRIPRPPSPRALARGGAGNPVSAGVVVLVVQGALINLAGPHTRPCRDVTPSSTSDCCPPPCPNTGPVARSTEGFSRSACALDSGVRSAVKLEGGTSCASAATSMHLALRNETMQICALDHDALSDGYRVELIESS